MNEKICPVLRLGYLIVTKGFLVEPELGKCMKQYCALWDGCKCSLKKEDK